MAKSRHTQTDIDVGKRIRALRVKAHLSQSQVGNSLGLTFQQIQKYEQGKNRVGPDRLRRLGKLFDVPVSVFFGEDGSANIMMVDPRLDTNLRHQLFENLLKLDNPKFEHILLDLVNLMAGRK